MKPVKAAYVNGRVVPASGAHVSVFDRGFLYGDGVFETIRYSNGRAAHKDEHIRRLLKGLSLIGIPAKGVKGLLKEVDGGIVERLIEKNGLKDKNANVRITVTRGVDPGGHLPSPGTAPTCVIAVRPVDDKFIKRIQKNGVRAVTLTGIAPALPPSLRSVKSLNFLPNVLGKIEAAGKGAFEGVFAGKDGVLLEGTATNVFIVKKGRLLTPALSGRSGNGPLPGVMRGVVLKTARGLGIDCGETTVRAKDLAGAEEAFLTNSIIEVVPLIEVDGRGIGHGKPGAITRAIQTGLIQV